VIRVPHLPASHLLSLVIFSALVATTFATLLRDELAARLRLGALLFGAFVLSSIVVGWLMYPFPS
jgi:hypothetical protein